MKTQETAPIAILPILLVLLSVAGLMLYILPAWTIEQKTGHRMVNHEFDFGGVGTPENQGAEILDFQYGDSKVTGTYVEDEWRAIGRVGQSGGVAGTMPVGDFLYVKWRILTSGEICEDRVDLRNRLPSDMRHKIIHFAINGKQLVVFLIEGNTSAQLHAAGMPDCPASGYGPFQCTRIYPDHWANF